MKINKEIARNLAWDGECDGFTIKENVEFDSSRWSIISRLTVEKGGKFYQAIYSKGATECQDERPFEDEGGEVEFAEVFAHEVIKTVYR